MKLLELKLINIGPYHNETINFQTNRQKNIVLLCGENGAGKTTFLKAVKLGLFGGALYGFKQQSKSALYIDEVKSIVRHNCKNGSIDITFSIIEDYKEVVYRIKRQWDVVPTFKEKIDLFIDEKKINDDEMVNKMDYINNYYTPSIVDSIMFDGEKIIGLIDNGQLSTYVKESILNLFGLNNYLSLISNLDEYLKEYINNENLSIEQIQLNEVERNLKIGKSQLKKEQVKLNDLKRLIEVKQYIIKEKIESYSKLGGVNKKDLNLIIDKISSMEKNRENNRNQVKNFFENHLLFLLCEDQINNAIKQIHKEEPKRHLENLYDLINANILNESDICAVNSIIKNLSSNKVDSNYINLSRKEVNEFQEMLYHIESAKDEYGKLKHNDDDELTLIRNLKNKVQISQTEEMNKLYQEISFEIREKEEINEQIIQTIKKIEELEVQNKSIHLKVEELKKTVFEQTKENDSYVLAKKYQGICQKYFDDEVERITKLISSQCTKLIKKTYRKKNYITKLVINNNFEISIYSGKDKKQITQLSAGEKQLLVASIISTIVKSSSRNTFIVFDTPVGRLDNEHIVRFYKNIMLDSANQVIIMPTSNEINDEVLHEIKSYVSECYTIQYNNQGYSHIVENRIFEKEWCNYDTKN